MGLWEKIVNTAADLTSDRLFNKAGEHRNFHCEECNEVTEHISVSHSEGMDRLHDVMAKPLYKTFGADSKEYEQMKKVTNMMYRPIGRINDLNPLANVFWGRPFRCTKCKAVRFR